MKKFMNVLLISLLFASIFGVIDLGFNTNEVEAYPEDVTGVIIINLEPVISNIILWRSI